MLLGTFSVLFTTNVFAADETEEGDDEQITVEIEEIADYTTQLFATPEEKLATMKLFLTKGDYQLYVDDYSERLHVSTPKQAKSSLLTPTT